MHIITTKAHALLDYLVGALLFASPWLFGFDNGGAQMAIPVILGTVIPIGALFTRYEGGLIRVIPMNAHLVFDVIAGLFLAGSPWIFGFAWFVYLPHLVFGLIIFCTTLLTDSKPYNKPNPDRAMP